jgi:DNA-directed RNA polymerase specialized sigma24 family protein
MLGRTLGDNTVDKILFEDDLMVVAKSTSGLRLVVLRAPVASAMQRYVGVTGPHLLACREPAQTSLMTWWPTPDPGKPLEPPRSVERCQRLGEQLIRGLVMLHQANLVHGNISPRTVYNRRGSAILADAGIAVALAPFCGPSTGIYFVEARYSTPEQTNDGPTPAADVFQLGAILYWLAYGVHAFPTGRMAAGLAMAAGPPNAPRDQRTLPDAMAHAISAALQPDPAFRPSAPSLLNQWTAVSRWGDLVTRAKALTENRTRQFPGTRWSLILDAGAGGSDAFSALCHAYWFPLYGYLRRRGYDEHRAQDLTQAFFANLLAKGAIAKADRDRGRFRTFLLTAIRNFVANEHAKNTTKKRGGDETPLSLDWQDAEGRYRAQAVDVVDAEKLFERSWAKTLLARARGRVSEHYKTGDKIRIYEALSPLLDDGLEQAYGTIADRLGMSEGAVKVAAHRLKKRYRDAIVEEVGETVDDPADIEREIGLLLQSLAV